MKRVKWTVSFSQVFVEERDRSRKRLAERALFAGLRSSPASAAEKAAYNIKIFEQFLDAITELGRPKGRPDLLPGAYDEFARPIPNFSKLELRPWIAYIYLDTSSQDQPKASGAIMFHEDYAPASIRRALKIME